MTTDHDRYQREMNHNKKILDRADAVWGRENLAGTMRTRRRVAMIIDQGALQKGKTVLEIGCGTGTISALVARSQASIIATDAFKEFLDKAKRTVHLANLQFKQADAHTLSNFSDNSFDVVYGISILHHLEIDPALESIYRVLKPKGLMLFSEPNMLNPQIALQKNIPFLKRLLGDSPDEIAFFTWQMRSLLQNHHFIAIEVTPFDFLHPFIPDIFAKPMYALGAVTERLPLVKEIAGSIFIKAKKPV